MYHISGGLLLICPGRVYWVWITNSFLDSISRNSDMYHTNAWRISYFRHGSSTILLKWSSSMIAFSDSRPFFFDVSHSFNTCSIATQQLSKQSIKSADANMKRSLLQKIPTYSGRLSGRFDRIVKPMKAFCIEIHPVYMESLPIF